MTVDELVAGVLDGRPAAIARTISAVERGGSAAEQAMDRLYPKSGAAHVVGVTGIPGSGKSTLVARLAQQLRADGRTVGIVAVDPSSPYSGGSILGDRIRMGELAGDPGVFVRSMATRGALGGLARATVDAVTVLDAAGKDVVIVETVGVGQDEVDIAAAAHTTAVVSVPGTGDSVQASKAGILEIADLHVVNKADCDGANRLVAELKEMLLIAGLRGGVGAWHVPVISTVAERGDGSRDVLDTLDQHLAWLRRSDGLGDRERHMAEARMRAIVHAVVGQRLDEQFAERLTDDLVGEVASRACTPLRAATELLDHITAPPGTSSTEGAQHESTTAR